MNTPQPNVGLRPPVRSSPRARLLAASRGVGWLALGALLGLLAACDGRTDLRPAVAAETEEARELPLVEVFLTDWCPYCQRLEAFLEANEVPYLRKNIEQSGQYRAEHTELGGGGIPVTRIGGTEVVRGFRPDVIADALGIEPR